MARLISLPSARGPIRCAYHPVEDAPVAEATSSRRAAVAMVGGGDGGLDGPAEAIYPTLAGDLAAHGIASLRVDFRIHQFPGDLDEGVHDLLEGVRFLLADGVERIGVLGHSFGGAVVIDAAAQHHGIDSVVTLATQTAGAQRVADIAPRPLLLVHGLDDVRLTPDCSRQLHRLAGAPKRLELLERATHSLRQRREDLRTLLRDWFLETLGPST